MLFAVVSPAGFQRRRSEKMRKYIFSFCSSLAVVAQLVEHVIGNDEVGGSIPPNGSRIKLNGFSEAEMRAARSAA